MSLFFKNIEELGNKCLDNHPIDFKRVSGSSFRIELNSWIDSIRYFYFHAFMRGRRDSLSERYFKYFLKIIEINFSNNFIEFNNFINSNSDSDIRKLFYVGVFIEEKETFLNNKKDVNMILSSFKKINIIKDGNIINYLRNNISGGLEEKYNYLLEITEIGPKISAFLLRNIVLHYGLNYKDEDIKFLLPIDTWIDKICLDRKIYAKEMKIEEKRKCIISLCKENHVNPLLFNAGLWHLGSTSLDISIKMLTKYEY